MEHSTDEKLSDSVTGALSLQRQISDMARDNLDCRRKMLVEAKRFNDFIEKFEPYLEQALLTDKKNRKHDADLTKLKERAQQWGIKGAAGLALLVFCAVFVSICIAVALQFHHYVLQVLSK